MAEKPIAIRKLIRDPLSNKIRTTYIDSRTGQPVSSLTNHRIVEAREYLDPKGLVNPFVREKDDDDSTAKEVTKENLKTPSVDRNGPAGSVSSTSNTTGGPGFIGGPVETGIGVAGMLPGVVGMLGKGVSVGINANNLGAINEARSDLGLGPLGPGQTLAGLLGFGPAEQGTIGDVSIGQGPPTTVSFSPSPEPGPGFSVSPETAVGMQTAASIPDTVSFGTDVLGYTPQAQETDDTSGFLSSVTGIAEGSIGDSIGSALGSIGQGIGQAVSSVGESLGNLGQSVMSAVFGGNPDDSGSTSGSSSTSASAGVSEGAVGLF